ncbi:Zinc finger protein 398 like protein [Argiope bruennichi]|uniref:Zinc finger protein 398 like protein n=1 Tax=Argiope bruennichi TaxID=94029 RepID=A0A8T0EBC9_ARGBR|nr:Zinc finger protein 398 like protein [Argiope bruennichi]
MEKDMDSSAMESKDSDCETVYVITEEELNNSFISENIGKEIIIDGSFFIVGENSFSLDGQDIQSQDKENMDGKELISVVLEKNDSNTVDNRGNVYGSLINNVNDNENVTTRNENSFIDKNQPTTVNHEQNILSGHSQNSYMDVEENLSLDSVEDSSIVHHQEKVTTPGKNCILSVSGHVQLQPSDWDMLTCPYCMTNFSKAYIMKRHMVTVHKFLSSEAPFPCFYCNALCQQEDLLLKHYEIEHKYQQQTALLITRMYSADPHRFVCSYCSKKFAKPCHLKKHLEIKHNFTSDEVAFPCGFKSCKMSFEKQILLLKHYEKEHNQKEQTALESTENNGDALPSEVASDRDNEIEILSQIKSRTDKLKSSEPIPASKKNIGRIKCIECNVNCTSFRTFREHLLKYHKLDVTEKEIRFPNMTAFKKWKLEIERRDLTFFTAQMGAKKLQNYFWRQYCCHRSGYYKQGNKVKKSRMDNLLGSCKTGFFCTASMTVREYPDEVYVKYCLQHYGHGGGTTFVHLSDEEQAAVQGNC